MKKDNLLKEEAEQLLELLTKYYKQPVMPMNRFCETMRTWMDCVVKNNTDATLTGEDGRQGMNHGSEYYKHFGSINTDISKSNLLGRMFYGGEKLRTRMCPTHKGHWSGINSCIYYCGSTGWIHEDITEEDLAAVRGSVDDLLANGCKGAYTIVDSVYKGSVEDGYCGGSEDTYCYLVVLNAIRKYGNQSHVNSDYIIQARRDLRMSDAEEFDPVQWARYVKQGRWYKEK